MSGYHIWQHLMWEVELKTYMQDGVVYERGRYGNDYEATGYYVHPETGVLEYKKPERYRYRSPQDKETTKISLVDGWFEKIDGLWFRFINKGTKEQFMWEYGTYLTLPYIIKKSANRKEISWIKAQISGKV